MPYQCFNETPCSVHFRIDRIVYDLMPKGKSIPDENKFDCAIIRDEHINHEALVPFLMCHPPKLRLEQLQQMDNTQTFNLALDKILNETTESVARYKATLRDNIQATGDKAGAELLKGLLGVSGQIDSLTARLTDIVKVMDNLKTEVENIEKKVTSAPKNAPKRSGTGLFEQG
jgi:hypothetical protein